MSSVAAHRGRKPAHMSPWPNGTNDAVDRTGATLRQVNYWATHGLLGPHQANLGSGGRRTFTGADLEIVWGLARLADLGCIQPFLEAAADAIRARRVEPLGELLVVRLDLACRRHQLGEWISVGEPSWVVPLLPFADDRDLREHAVPCSWCAGDAWAADAVCDAPTCRIRQAHHLALSVRR